MDLDFKSAQPDIPAIELVDDASRISIVCFYDALFLPFFMWDVRFVRLSLSPAKIWKKLKLVSPVARGQIDFVRSDGKVLGMILGSAVVVYQHRGPSYEPYNILGFDELVAAGRCIELWSARSDGLHVVDLDSLLK